ncbi:uncharacterized protein BO80DRAFT_501618 [Aspergillus ibericus CBS 121593]|uniref:Uncharacterized protein n=1 Tax=Aspergillus ibericus CBS 121593 TaxID=1448316 RepID=A0A395H5Z8_9EURO|nr:hypothetical protein BO80DRAFT_501618 [Aspergillus ibericus CBS 121593]RAL01694.1 hypothetical protein BO80DRAFT_501618 [Aspergillus ibericus CBS 121593]
MTATVRSLLGTFNPQPMDIDTNPTLSSKQWTEDFPPFEQQYVRVWAPTVSAVEEFLGPGRDTPSGADGVGLETVAHVLNTYPQVVSSEGDVTRDFDQNIIVPVALAFSGHSAWSSPSPGVQAVPGAPTLWSRSLVGAKRVSSSTRTVDYQMTMSHVERSLERPAMIGEMKKPRVIRRKEWTFEEEASGTTIRLAQELRAYACEYRCPQVFVFDMKTLVLVQFRALRVEDISAEDCPVDICVIPRDYDPNIPDQCTMQFALYRLAWRGWVRLCATLECREDRRPGEYVRVPTHLNHGGLTRKYEYWSGTPIWVDHYGRQYLAHPSGCRRDFVYRSRPRPNGTAETQGFWVWRSQDGLIEDTPNAFISGY